MKRAVFNLIVMLLFIASFTTIAFHGAPSSVRAQPTEHSQIAVLSATQDTYIDNGRAATNFNDSPSLFIEKDFYGASKRTLVQFDLGNLLIGSTIITAQLRLNQTAAGCINSSSTIFTEAVLEPWGENVVTWDSRPRSSTQGDPGTFSNALGFRTWDVSNTAKKWADGTLTNNGLLLYNEITPIPFGNCSYQFSKRETPDAVQLIISYIPPSDGTLPIFQVAAPVVNDQTAAGLATQLVGIGNHPTLQDAYLGRPRFTVPNTDTGTLLEQYEATGGFYAYNAHDAAGETVRGTIDPDAARQSACTFLGNNNLFPANATSLDTRVCTNRITPLPYTVSLAHANDQGQQTQDVSETVIAAVVQVPLALDTSAYSHVPTIPLGGPGGHLSLLFRTTDSQTTGFSLDATAPGLSAVALPWYGRSITHLQDAPAIDPDAAQQEVTNQTEASFPDATSVNVPRPVLEYFVRDAAVEQRVLEPVFTFHGIEVVTPSGTVILRDISLPAVQSGVNGFGPSVVIITPTNGSTFIPGMDTTITGSISDGTAPYSYTWSLDDGTALDSGTSAAATAVTLTTNQLPNSIRDSTPQPITVHLSVQDATGAERETRVVLVPQTMQTVYLPVVINGIAQVRTSRSHNLFVSNYSYGVEWGNDYPPYGTGGSDLPGVVDDANGFRNGMRHQGWTSVFAWSNASAWERDWRDCSLGGGDCSYGVDRADFVYWAGHGNNGGISLPSSKDSSWFPGTNARFERARWVGFASCLTLRAQWPVASQEPIRNWFSSFQGAHMLLGFNSVMADVAFGPRLVDNMRVPKFLFISLPWAQRTIREAWVLTAFNMNAGKPAYVYAIGTNGVNPVDDKLPQPGDPLLPRPFPVASWRWVWWDE